MKTCLIFFLSLFLIAFVSAADVKNIEYAINITFTPECVNQTCSNYTVFDNATNMTFNWTNCSANCYGRIKLEGINENKIFFEIDTSLEEWRNGKSDIRYGYKVAEIGNLSDVSGIRLELENLSRGFSDLFTCNENLTSCVSTKSALDAQVIEKVNQINRLDNQVMDAEKQRMYYLVGGVLIGVVLISFIVPWFKGRNHIDDPSKKQFPSNIPY